MIINHTDRTTLDLTQTEALELIQELTKLVIHAQKSTPVYAWSKIKNVYAEQDKNHVPASLIIRVTED